MKSNQLLHGIFL